MADREKGRFHHIEDDMVELANGPSWLVSEAHKLLADLRLCMEFEDWLKAQGEE